MAEIVQSNRPMGVTTPLGKDVLILQGVTVQEGISQPFEIQLDTIAKKQTDVAFDKLLGQKITVELQLSSGKPRFFNGICIGVTQGGQSVDFTSYQLNLVPQFTLLQRRTTPRIFQQTAVPDILKEVLKGLDVSFEVQGSFQPRDYCVQYRETDFNFASRLMEEEGIYYFFRHSAGGHKMVIANTPQSHQDMPEKSQIAYEPIESQHPVPEGRIFEWQKTQELRSGKVTLWDHCFELPHKHLEADKAVVDSAQAGKVSHKLKVGGNDGFELYDFPGQYAQRFDGIDPGGGERAADLQKIFQDNKRTVEIRMQEETTSALVVRGVSNCRQMTSGYKFQVKNHYNGDGAYVMTGVNHAAEYFNDSDSFRYQNTFTCIPAAIPYRPSRVNPKPVVHGTQTAVVVGPAGEEIFTDKYGRIKVQFHWDRQGKNDANSSCWMRVGTIWAGKQWGAIHIPRIGQEVIVAFQEGDPDQPIIIGSVYNAEQMPPYKLPDNKTQSGVKSRSSLKGTPENFNELRFEDKKDSEQIYFHAEKDFDRVVENNDTLKVGFQKRDKGDQTVEVFNNQSLTVGKPSEGNKPTVESRVVQVWNNEEVKIGYGEKSASEGSQIGTVFNHRKWELKEGNDTLEIAKGNREATIKKGNDTLAIKMGNQSTKLDLGKSETEAMQSIELKVGQSSIKIDQTGVTIKGLMIKIEGTVQTEVKGLMTMVGADAILQVKGGITMIG